MRDCLDHVWRNSVSVKGTFARDFADVIAMAASMSLITTRVSPGVFAGSWQITTKGLKYVNENEDEE